MVLPADAHVHSEWSWDTGGPNSDAVGRMRLTCHRAVAIGLPAIIFTEHLDFDAQWVTDADDVSANQAGFRGTDGVMSLPLFDVAGYLASIDACRAEFPALRILTGLEFGQPHLHERAASRLLDVAAIDRVNGSLHTLPVDGLRYEPAALYRRWPADRVMQEYLEELPRMIAGSAAFEVLTHIDYAVRAWPIASDGPFDPRRFEPQFRAAMRTLAESGRALEMNTRRLWSWVPQWWSEEGGAALSFGSDSHTPASLAENFPEAVVMVEHYGFRAGELPEDLWVRT